MGKHVKREDNVQFVKRVMSTGSPLRQAFVLEAIKKYAEACAKEPASKFETWWLSGEAWVQIAKEIESEFVKRGL